MKITQNAYCELMEIANQLEYNVAAEVLSETMEEIKLQRPSSEMSL